MQLLFDLLFLLVVVYGFGTLLSGAFCSSPAKAISFAPLAAFGGLFLLSAACCAIGLAASWKGIVFAFCAISCVAFCIKLLVKKKGHSSNACEIVDLSADCGLLVLYVIVGIFVTGLVYVKTLDSAGSFFQGFDNYYHINTVRDYLNTGFFCSLPVTSYPNLWHCLAALTASFGASAIPTAINALNILLVGFVIPTSVYLFMDAVFYEDKRIVFAGAFTAVFCNTFPWNYVCCGPLYALLIGWSLLPLSMTLFIYLCRSETLISFVRAAVVFGLSCTLLVVAHPSVIFAGIAILTPVCCYSLFIAFRSRGFSQIISFVFAALFAFFVFLLWDYCFKSPFFSGVVNFPWQAPLPLSQAFSNAILGSLSPAHSPQFILMTFVLIGFFFVLKTPRYRWLAFSLGVSALICIISEGGNGYWRQFLCGFWYNDWNRLMGLYGFMLVIVAAPGLALFFNAVETLYDHCDSREVFVNHNQFSLLVCSFLLIVILLPSFSVSNGKYVTPYGYVRNKLIEYNDLSQNAFCLDSSEIAFTNKVKAIVGDSKVLNYPYDGSCYSYAISDLNIVNRTWWVTDLDESHPDALIRMKIDMLATDKEVKSVCSQEGISYVMLLDYGHPFGDGVFNYDNRIPDAWTGLTSINDSTPGFELLLSEGDMRLYRISD